MLTYPDFMTKLKALLAEAERPDYPPLPAGFVTPKSMLDAKQLILPTWFNGVATTGDPSLIDWTSIPGAARLKWVGNATAGKCGELQSNAGNASARRGALVDCVKPDAVCAVFAYGKASEIDFELIRRNGVLCWSLGLHMLNLAKNGRVKITDLITPPLPAFKTGLHKLEFQLTAANCKWWIDDVEVWSVTPDQFAGKAIWDATSGTQVFCSVETHGAWAGQSYTGGTAQMDVYGLRV